MAYNMSDYGSWVWSVRQDKLAVRRVIEQDNELLKNIRLTHWRFVQLSFGLIVSSIKGAMLYVDREAVAIHKIMQWAAYWLTVFVFKCNVRRFNIIVKGGLKHLDALDGRIDKPLVRPEKLVLPNFHEAYKTSDWVTDVISNAYAALSEKLEEWQSVFELAEHKMESRINGADFKDRSLSVIS